MMLQIKFGCNRPAGLRDIHVWKCGQKHGRTDARTDARTPARVPSYKLTLWAFGSGELIMEGSVNKRVSEKNFSPKTQAINLRDEHSNDCSFFLYQKHFKPIVLNFCGCTLEYATAKIWFWHFPKLNLGNAPIYFWWLNLKDLVILLWPFTLITGVSGLEGYVKWTDLNSTPVKYTNNMDGWMDGWIRALHPFQHYFSHNRPMEGRTMKCHLGSEKTWPPSGIQIRYPVIRSQEC